MGLGSFPEVTLKFAREKALEARRLKVERVDPIAARRSARQKDLAAIYIVTFKLAAERFIDSKQGGWRHRGKSADQWRAALRDWVYPIIGNKPVAEVDGASVLAVLTQPVKTQTGIQRFWEARSETASRCRARIANVLDYSRANGLRSGDNPAEWATLRFTLPKRADVRAVRHHEAMAYDDVPVFMAKLRKSPASSARALEFTILTGARTTEVRAMTWSEVDFSKVVWTVPAARMKGKKAHRVPLTMRTVKILSTMSPGSSQNFVFPGIKPGRPMSENTMLKLLQELKGDVTVHGFRSALSTWAREQTSFAREIVEASLAHTVGDAVERAYARTDFFDKRRSLLVEWSTYCDG